MSGEFEWPEFERPRSTNLEVAEMLEKMGIPDAYISPEEAEERGLREMSPEEKREFGLSDIPSDEIDNN